MTDKKLSAAQRRRLHRELYYSSNKCADCHAPVKYWTLPKGVPTCNVCGGTRPLGGTIQRSHT